jgi:hypothetical protein
MDCHEKGVISPDELMSALKRYVEQCGKTEQEVASQIGVNHHTLGRWLSEKGSPKKREAGSCRILSQAGGILVKGARKSPSISAPGNWTA